MSIHLKQPVNQPAAMLRRDQRGQMAILMVMVLPVVFLLFALALDAGIWFFDHRLAQNQADAAVLAAVQFLPADDPSLNKDLARGAAIDWLVRNGSAENELCDSSYPQFYDLFPASTDGDGRIDAVRVCVRRPSQSFFSGLANLDLIYVSAAATARVGPVGSIANVMPWGLVPPDPTCTGYNEECRYDMNNDGDDEICGNFPPLEDGQSLCPWGLSEDRLYVFKYADPVTPGNFAPISACGLGNVEYQDCIQGEVATRFYAEGETVNIATQPGNLGTNTYSALSGGAPDYGRYYDETQMVPPYPCDIVSTPNTVTGMDPDGKRRAEATFVEGRSFTDEDPLSPFFDQHFPFVTSCDFRLVSIPILQAFPATGASEDILVLGVSTFAIAGWDRTNPNGNAVGRPGYECDDPPPGPPPDPGEYFECGMVWGYLIADAFPPDTLVNSISETANPFAPLLIAMVE